MVIVIVLRLRSQECDRDEGSLWQAQAIHPLTTSPIPLLPNQPTCRSSLRSLLGVVSSLSPSKTELAPARKHRACGWMGGWGW